MKLIRGNYIECINDNLRGYALIDGHKTISIWDAMS